MRQRSSVAESMDTGFNRIKKGELDKAGFHSSDTMREEKATGLTTSVGKQLV